MAMGENQEADEFRSYLADKAGEFIKGLISPKPANMTKRTIIITALFRGERETIERAVREGERRAQSESANSVGAKMLFGILRVMGFGRIEPTGMGNVESKEVEPGLCEVRVVLEVEVENNEKFVAASESLNQKMDKIPERLIYKMLGVDPSKLTLVSVHLQVGNALPWTE